jgi:hypothetical protein
MGRQRGGELRGGEGWKRSGEERKKRGGKEGREGRRRRRGRGRGSEKAFFASTIGWDGWMDGVCLCDVLGWSSSEAEGKEKDWRQLETRPPKTLLPGMLRGFREFRGRTASLWATDVILFFDIYTRDSELSDARARRRTEAG